MNLGYYQDLMAITISNETNYNVEIMPEVNTPLPYVSLSLISTADISTKDAFGDEAIYQIDVWCQSPNKDRQLLYEMIRNIRKVIRNALYTNTNIASIKTSVSTLDEDDCEHGIINVTIKFYEEE